MPAPRCQSSCPRAYRYSAFYLYGFSRFVAIFNPPGKAVAGGHTLEAVLSYRYHVLVSQVVTPPEFSGTSNVCAASNGLRLCAWIPREALRGVPALSPGLHATDWEGFCRSLSFPAPFIICLCLISSGSSTPLTERREDLKWNLWPMNSAFLRSLKWPDGVDALAAAVQPIARSSSPGCFRRRG
jgi:hypothetical protein